MLRGSCLCGGVRYRVARLASPIQHCACHTCRKAHAAAFNSGASVAAEDFEWQAGEQLLKHFESSPGKRRYFCSHCGTHLIARREGKPTVRLRVATLDDDPGEVPMHLIWASHQVPWLKYPAEITYDESEPE